MGIAGGYKQFAIQHGPSLPIPIRPDPSPTRPRLTPHWPQSLRHTSKNIPSLGRVSSLLRLLILPSKISMWSRSVWLSALLLFLLPLQAALVLAANVAEHDVSVQLLHRVYHRDIPQQPFTPRASLHPHSLQLLPVPSLHDDLAQLYELARTHKDALYQLALQRVSGSVEEETLDIAVVKAVCIAIALQASSFY